MCCFAATHDVELTGLLEAEYDNYHFEEQIADGDISFPYLLMPGRATSRNAIRLLEMMGYSEEIIKKADDQAAEFLKTDVYKRQGDDWWVPPTDVGLADTGWVCDGWYLNLLGGDENPDYAGTAELYCQFEDGQEYQLLYYGVWKLSLIHICLYDCQCCRRRRVQCYQPGPESACAGCICLWSNPDEER